jgi:hypothetical protein
MNVLKNHINNKIIDSIGFTVPPAHHFIAESSIQPINVVTINSKAAMIHPTSKPIHILPINCRHDKFHGSLKMFFAFSGFSPKFVVFGIVWFGA